MKAKNGEFLSQLGYIYAGKEIRLKAPFYIDEGANVHIAIREAHCGGSQNRLPVRIPYETEETDEPELELNEQKEFSVSPNPAAEYIEILSKEALSDIFIINSSGQRVLHSTNTYIPVYGLPAGLYIVCATTEDNVMLQTKFLKQ